MATTLERLTKVETLLEGMAPKVDALHEHFLEGKGARDARRHRFTVHHLILTVATSLVTATASAAAVLKSLSH